MNSTIFTIPSQIDRLLREKSANFTSRPHIFSTFADFLQRQNRGYFTIVGAPGSGKTAVLAKYVAANPDAIYYSAALPGKNRADVFLADLCSQLIQRYDLEVSASPDSVLPDSAVEGSWLFSLLLQKVSRQLEPNQKLIIAIDALEFGGLDSGRYGQIPGSNIFYLPRYLPDRIYFLLARRPFPKEKSGLLIEAPAQILNLEDCADQNRQDIRAYISAYISAYIEERLAANQDSPFATPEFAGYLAAKSDTNFMYASQILDAISRGFYADNYAFGDPGFDPLPPELEAYYRSSWQQMQAGELSAIARAVLRVLLQQSEPLSAAAISFAIDADEYEVEEILEDWLQFLRLQEIGAETGYAIYHSSFRDFLEKML